MRKIYSFSLSIVCNVCSFPCQINSSFPLHLLMTTLQSHCISYILSESWKSADSREWSWINFLIFSLGLTHFFCAPWTLARSYMSGRGSKTKMCVMLFAISIPRIMRTCLCVNLSLSNLPQMTDDPKYGIFSSLDFPRKSSTLYLEIPACVKHVLGNFSRSGNQEYRNSVWFSNLLSPAMYLCWACESFTLFSQRFWLLDVFVFSQVSRIDF